VYVWGRYNDTDNTIYQEKEALELKNQEKLANNLHKKEAQIQFDLQPQFSLDFIIL
jgi:hypothetical protein